MRQNHWREKQKCRKVSIHREGKISNQTNFEIKQKSAKDAQTKGSANITQCLEWNERGGGRK
jgi:hypothetical protein